MKKMILCLCLFAFAGCTHSPVKPGTTTLCIIGTEHDPSEFIHPEILFAALEQVKPNVILCELDSGFFTDDFRFDLEKYPDLLTTNENIAAHRYQEQYAALLYPYEMEGRNDYYRETAYFERQNKMFTEIMNAFQENSLSEKSRTEWERYLQTVKLFDVFHNRTLKEINQPLYTNYSEAKNLITFDTFVSIAERDLPHWLETAKMMKSFWQRRNSVMAENILKGCAGLDGQTIVVLTGQQHKAPLLTLLQNREEANNWLIKEFWEFESSAHNRIKID